MKKIIGPNCKGAVLSRILRVTTRSTRHVWSRPRTDQKLAERKNRFLKIILAGAPWPVLCIPSPHRALKRLEDDGG